MDTRQDKKQQFVADPKKGRSKLLVTTVVVAGLLAAVGLFVVGGGAGTADAFVTAQNGQVSLPLADVQDGKAHYYAYRAADGNVSKFFLLKSHDGAIRAAFDACDVCYKSLKGYRQEGDSMVCNNCNQQFSSDRINEVKGGCNPAPLTRTISGDQVVLIESELQAGVRYFPRA
jgi:uncharacterized membrane protein